ncbi:UNVERIFIED_CONTAM: hypothetical protein Sradi_5349300 [Sesamum radiatum]|uniref:Transmembrane protein n=1 Tax=Sesamum radiatum TaxID=300843 RepID=A0AAW2LQC8_SESRA
MEIREKLLKFKLHILSVLAFSFLIISICYLAPRFLDVLKYFWPLLVSTALFLVAVVVFDRISPPSVESPGEKAGEGLLEFVAGETATEEVEAAAEEESVKAE